ncbi:MAG: aldo/keto reductase [Chloroflexia bacterium]
MEYTWLGRTGLRVSPLCLGTMNFGEHTPPKDAFGIMDRALEHGLNFFDTANVYGGAGNRGRTEEILGEWLAQGGERREQVVLATKVYGGTSDRPNDSGLSARNIKLSCEASLRRLKTDHIDLYQMHHVHRDTPWEEIWQAMEQLVREGKVIYIGSSNFAGWNIVQANEAARRRNFLGLVSEQSLYNLMSRTIELEVLPACEEYGLGVIPYSPLGGGMLGGVLQRASEGRRAGEGVEQRVNENRDRLEAYEDCCRDLGEEPANVALAWLLSNPVVTAPIIGPRTREQLDAAIRATEIKLSPETLERLDEIFPGPGGPAPEAYAW